MCTELTVRRTVAAVATERKTNVYTVYNNSDGKKTFGEWKKRSFPALNLPSKYSSFFFISPRSSSLYFFLYFQLPPLNKLLLRRRIKEGPCRLEVKTSPAAKAPPYGHSSYTAVANGCTVPFAPSAAKRCGNTKDKKKGGSAGKDECEAELEAYKLRTCTARCAAEECTCEINLAKNRAAGIKG